MITDRIGLYTQSYYHSLFLIDQRLIGNFYMDRATAENQ